MLIGISLVIKNTSPFNMFINYLKLIALENLEGNIIPAILNPSYNSWLLENLLNILLNDILSTDDID